MLLGTRPDPWVSEWMTWHDTKPNDPSSSAGWCDTERHLHHSSKVSRGVWKPTPWLCFTKFATPLPWPFKFRCDLVVSLQYFNLLNPLSTGPVQSIRQLFEWPGNWNVEQGACCLNNGHCWNQFKQISSSWDWKTGVGEENGQKLNYNKRRPENIIKFHHIISSAITWWMPHWCA